MTVCQFSNQDRVVSQPVPRHAIHCINDGMKGITSRPLIINVTNARSVESTILTIRNFCTYGSRTNTAPPTQTKELDVTRIDEAIFARCHIDLGRQPGLIVIKLAIKGAHSRSRTLECVHRHYTPIGIVAPKLGLRTV